MRSIHYWVALIMLGTSTAWADCSGPAAPILPDGATASMQEMVDGQQAVRAYQAANVEYMQCLEERFTAAKKAAKKASAKDDAAEAQATYSAAVEAYNAAVSEEEQVAGEFNVQIREYKAANAN